MTKKIDWTLIRQEWETSKVTYKALAEKYGVKVGTLKSRSSREKWSRNKDATEKKKVATLERKLQPKIDDEEPVELSDELTDKQRLFCIYYIKSFNQTMAAIKAGYSRDRAHVTGSELVRNSKVAAEIRRLKGELQQGIFIDAMDVLNKYIQIAFADITDYTKFGRKEVDVIDDLGNTNSIEVNYVDFKESSDVDGTIITEVKQGKDGITVKLADKMRALEFLAKHFDMVPDHFKRQLEQEKLKIAHSKVFGFDEREEFEDDGFNEALNATTAEVWPDDKNMPEADE